MPGLRWPAAHAPKVWYEMRDKWDWVARAEAFDREQRAHADRLSQAWCDDQIENRQKVLDDLFARVRAASSKLDQIELVDGHMRCLKDYASAADTYLIASRRECGIEAVPRRGRPTMKPTPAESDATSQSDRRDDDSVQQKLDELPDSVLAELAAEGMGELNEDS